MRRAMITRMPSVVSDAQPSAGRTVDPLYQRLLRRRNLFASLAILFLVLVVVGGVLDEVTSAHEDRSFQVGAAPRLVIRDAVSGGLRGNIDVRVGRDDRIDVEGKVHGTWRVRYRLEQRGDEVLLDVQPRLWIGWLGLLSPARFLVRAPAGTQVDIETRRAPISVQGLAGGGALRTTDGTVRLDGAGGRLAATTTNGAITARGFHGTADFQTTNGAIDVRGSQGGFNLKTTNGAIDLDAELHAGVPQRLEVTNGAVTVHLRGEPNLRVDARTINGAVSVRRPLVANERAPHAVSGVIGSGDGELLVRSTNGSITIE